MQNKIFGDKWWVRERLRDKKKWKQTVMGNILAIYWKSSLGEVIIILQISVHMKEGHLYTHQKLLFASTM